MWLGFVWAVQLLCAFMLAADQSYCLVGMLLAFWLELPTAKNENATDMFAQINLF